MAESKTLHERLAEVQATLKAPKGQHNSFGGYKYRSCEDILEAVKPLLKEQGLVLTLSDELKNIGDRYYIEAHAFVFMKEGAKDSSEMVHVSAFAREEETKKGMDGSQITGTASSYARKYALNGLFLIDDTKDADTDEHHNQTTSRASDPVPQAKAAKPATPSKAKDSDGYYNEYEKKTYYPEPCEVCGREVPAKSVSFSQFKYSRTLCYDDQQKAEAGELDTTPQTAQQGSDELDNLFKQRAG